MSRRFALLVTAASLFGLLSAAGPVAAGDPDNPVLDWNQYAVEAIFNPGTADVPGAGQTPPVGGIHLAMVQIAVYDAIIAITGGFEPYLDGLPNAPSTASKKAAVATAAHHVLVGLGTVGNAPPIPAAAITRLDGLLAADLGEIPAGPRKTAGKAIGAAAAAAILADRENDGRGSGSFLFTVGTLPGQWRPTAPSGLNDPFAWVRDVRPFALRRGAQFISQGVPALTSDRYTAQFAEVKALGSVDSTERTAGQTATAMYFTENPFTLFNRSYRALAGPDKRDLSLRESARLLAMTNVAGADALIACWHNKSHWSNWRPETAIKLAADDGNPATEADATWTSLVPAPPYPDNTSGYNCATGGHMAAARAFFGKNAVRFKLINATGVERRYERFSGVLADTIDARVWLGLHFRFADKQGAWVGRNVGSWVGDRFFEPVG